MRIAKPQFTETGQDKEPGTLACAVHRLMADAQHACKDRQGLSKSTLRTGKSQVTLGSRIRHHLGRRGSASRKREGLRTGSQIRLRGSIIRRGAQLRSIRKALSSCRHAWVAHERKLSVNFDKSFASLWKLPSVVLGYFATLRRTRHPATAWGWVR